MNIIGSKDFVARGLLSLSMLGAAGIAIAQADVDRTPSREAIEEAARDQCNGASVVLQRCPPKPEEAAKKNTADPASKSRDAAKAAMDRKDERGRAAALDGSKKPDDAAIATQRLDTVNVEGTGEKTMSLEDVLQRALNPGQSGVPGANGTVSHYAPDGVRYDCIQKCVGPACCTTVRSMPTPARDSNSIGR